MRVSVVIPVYRDADRAIALVHALSTQRLPSGVDVERIVVDDGSGDGSADRIQSTFGGLVRIERLSVNVGRAVARNIGAAVADGDWLFFMDCDCLPADDALIAGLLAQGKPGVVAVIGGVTGTGDGFWHRYQSTASQRRFRQHAAGLVGSGSSQNLMVLRSAFEACGGFDAAYRTYGFEDRDLQLRLSTLGRIASAETTVVRHMDTLSLAEVSRKMIEAGGSSAILFSRRHPDAYRALGYAALDVRQRRWLSIPARMLDPLVQPFARLADRLIDCRRAPDGLKAGIVKLMTGAAYLVGTARAMRAAGRGRNT
jgi:glycosyltransferase involved in cell wall biosynthesis